MSRIYGMECGECHLKDNEIDRLKADVNARKHQMHEQSVYIATLEARVVELEAQRDRLKVRVAELETDLVEGKRLADLICNSPPDTTIKGEIESMAFEFVHLCIVRAPLYRATEALEEE